MDYETLRKEIAIEHNTLLSKDDPLLIIPTINMVVLENAVDLLNERQAALLKAIEVSQQKAIADAKQTASKIITEAADYVSEQVHTAVTAAMEEYEPKVQVEDSRINSVDPWLIWMKLSSALAMGIVLGLVLKFWWDGV